MTKVDLSQLRIDESTSKPRRPLGPRILTISVLVLLTAVALTFLWPLLRSTREVVTWPVRAAATSAAKSSIATAEAVGWVEPDPFPTIVKPLVSGRVQTIDVLEGHEVVAGETVLASLESASLMAAHERAAAHLAEREAEHGVAVTTHEQAKARRQQLAGRRDALALAKIAVSNKQTALATANGAARELAAAARAAAAALQAQERLTAEGSGHAVALERARAESAAADAAAARALSEVQTIERELDEVKQHQDLQLELYRDPVDLDSDVRVTATKVEQAAKRRDSAATELAIAERELDWARRVVAPASGIVMRLIASPGETTGPGGEGIIALYDPKKLQARLDVPLDSVEGIHPGQDVELTSEVSGNTIVKGVVARIQHETDMLKNTLEVKVRLSDPPAIWRPETLCRARFLGGTANADPSQPAGAAAFIVPRAAVQGDQVFVFDPALGVARAVTVKIVGEDGDRVIVQGELSVTQRVIRDAVVDGERVQEIRQ